MSAKVVLFITILSLAWFGAGKFQKDRALFERVEYLTNINIDLPLNEVSQELLSISAETNDADLRYIAFNGGSVLGYYSGTGIRSLRDFRSAGHIERAARGLLQMFIDPVKLMDAFGSAFQADYNLEKIKDAEERVNRRYDGFNYQKWAFIAIVSLLSGSLIFYSRKCNSILSTSEIKTSSAGGRPKAWKIIVTIVICLLATVVVLYVREEIQHKERLEQMIKYSRSLSHP